ncbi:MAG: cytochrome P450 [Actinomycetes bacterium]|jgi:cytochrome P450
MVGSFGSIRRNPAAFLEQIWSQFGDVVQFPIPRPAVYLLSSPTDVRSVLVDSVSTQSKRTLQYDNLAILTGDGLLTADDPPWREHRRVVQPAFHTEELDAVCAHTAQATQVFLDRWDQLPVGSAIDIDEAMMEISLQVVASSLFGSDWRQAAGGLTKATITALDEVVARARNPLAPPLWVPTGRNRALRRAKAALDAAVDSLIANYRAEPRAVVSPEVAGPGESATPQKNEESGTPRFLELLVTGMRRPDGSLDRQAVRDELVTFLVAGHETVASALTWAWYLLAENPNVAADLHKEVAALSPGTRWNMTTISSLPLTRAVVDETLRLYPPAWVLTRTSTVDRELGGVHVPAGSLLIMSPWILGRHPDAWQDPDRFDPQRFMGATSRNSRNRLGYLPFGTGPRMCIGREFALAEAVVVLAMVSARFDLRRPPPAKPITALASVTLRPPEGLAMQVYPR